MQDSSTGGYENPPGRQSWIQHSWKSMEQSCVYPFSILCFILFIMLIPPSHGGTKSLGYEALSNGAHVPLLGLATLSFAWILVACVRKATPFYVASLLSFFFAVAIEIIQPVFGRDFSLGDIGLDLIGIFGAWVLYRMLSTGMNLVSLANGLVCLGLVVWFAVLPVVSGYGIDGYMSEQFPLLSGFKVDGEENYWRSVEGDSSDVVSMDFVKHEGTGAEGTLYLSAQGKYAGAEYRPVVSDWSGYSWIKLSVENKGLPALVGIRIDDSGDSTDYGQRFNKAIELPSGESTIAISLEEVSRAVEDREFNISEIYRFLIFSLEETVKVELYIHSFKLT